MGRILAWIVLLAGLFIGYQAHWFDGILEYFSNSSKQEKVIIEPDGSTTTVKYKNVFDILLNK